MKKIIPLVFIINTSLLIISIAISFVILFRPFYYWQIKPLDIENSTSLTYNEIKETYDNILDYSLFNKSYEEGKLKCSNECIDHFNDCRTLFILNFNILIITSLLKIIEITKYRNLRIKKHSISFWSSCSILLIFALITIITLIVGFNSVFTLFHNIFFLGKTNWNFDPEIDTIIYIFPKQFFINCSILILSIISIISIVIIVKNLKKVVKK